ncbi:probable protein phosphatase 2C T23F11.1 [Halyomorpha halys]|uniref:probable protein phosphatase 2C T23F11.1 n=1 Tax=Halyomorpha halys TaxID=286706 RepID=UPI000D0C8AD5|nr:probable protein phosphatase 2C T23F11.1 [Halyomorpha halys]
MEYGLLGTPNTAMKNFYALTNDFMTGCGSMQGWRPTMEDSCTIIVTLPQEPFTSLFGVFDGHGGGVISDFVSKNIYYYIVSDPAFKEGAIKNALSSAFMRLDNLLMNDSVYNKLQGGSTAVVVLIRNRSLFCANLGDSRAVAYVSGEAIPLSCDHKPLLQKEKIRIFQAGCFIEYGRINGDLALSRAFGDFKYKKNNRKTLSEQAVISMPDVMEFLITKNWEFLVLACDGIWDTMTNEEVCSFVKTKISNNITVDVICQQLLQKCLRKEYPTPESFGTDNMTVIIVVFLDNVCRPYLGIVQQGCTVSSTVNFSM